MMPFKEETIIGMPPGIGDLHWIMTKMESFKKKNKIEKIKVVMNLPQTISGVYQYHDYSVKYLDLIPFIDSAENRLKPIGFEYALNDGSGRPLFINRNGCDYVIEFNSRLENHVKLKDILPEYETNYDYPIDEPEEERKFAKAFKETIGEKLVLFFTASIGGNDYWVKHLWTPESWMELARKIYNKTGCKIVLVGAKWDAPYAEQLFKLDTEKIIHSIIGKTTIAKLFAILREASLLITWQCGVGIMATQFRIPVVAFWPIKTKANPHGVFNRDFMRTWLPPWAKKVGYMPVAWGDEDATPEGVFDKIRRYL